jgi:uncharacterized membrane protein
MQPLRIAGHPLHPMVVHFPLAFWTAAAVSDVSGWITERPLWWMASWACHIVGLGMGIIAAILGFIEYATSVKTEAARDTAVVHMLSMSTAWLLFLTSLGLRGLTPGVAPSIWASGAALVGFVVMIIGAWGGGQLVYRHGVGMRDRANT